MNGMSSAFNRMLTGQNVFLTDFYYEGTTNGTVCLGTDFPSKILRFNLQDYPDSTLICQRGAYLASNSTVNIELEFTKTMTAGFFGGQGFILQKLTGTGDVLVKGGGTIKQLDLKPGETIRVTSGSIVAFESTVSYDVQMLPGIKNVMFGGEGLFVTTLSGPGQVWLQGMPPDRMIAEIAQRIPSSSGIGFGIPIGGLGGGGGAGDTPVDGATAGVDGVDGSSTIPGTESAIEADRNATIASSGLSDVTSGTDDIDSPSALFGDAAPADATSTMTNDTATTNDPFGGDTTTTTDFNDDDTSFSSSSSSSETTFTDDFEEDDFNNANEFTNDGELYDDTSNSESSNEVSSSTGDGDGGSSSIFQTLWDFITGGDDD